MFRGCTSGSARNGSRNASAISWQWSAISALISPLAAAIAPSRSEACSRLRIASTAAARWVCFCFGSSMSASSVRSGGDLGDEIARAVLEAAEPAVERVETLPDIVDFARDGFGIFADGGDGVGHGIGGEGGFVDGGGDRGDGLRLGFHCRTDAVGRFLDLGDGVADRGVGLDGEIGRAHV